MIETVQVDDKPPKVYWMLFWKGQPCIWHMYYTRKELLDKVNYAYGRQYKELGSDYFISKVSIVKKLTHKRFR